MSDTFISLSDLVSLNDKNAVDLGVTDLFNDSPLLKVLSATVASDGTVHKYIKESAAPTVGFRAINVGRSNSKSGTTLVTATLALLDGSFDVDKAMADSFVKGGPDAFMAREARKALKANFFALEKQIIQGTTGGDASGFSGLADTLTALSNAYVVNAAGTTAATASSIYLIRHNNEGTDLQVVMGNDGQIKIDPYFLSTVADSTSSRFTSYHQPIMGYAGLQYGGVASVVRIGNVTADSGKGATDALISKALALFPASRQPNVIVMGRRSLQQLQASRTATNPTGAPAPFPQDSFGIPIVVTDAIGATEALLT
jgi:hypothetical protein